MYGHEDQFCQQGDSAAPYDTIRPAAIILMDYTDAVSGKFLRSLTDESRAENTFGETHPADAFPHRRPLNGPAPVLPTTPAVRNIHALRLNIPAGQTVSAAFATRSENRIFTAFCAADAIGAHKTIKKFIPKRIEFQTSMRPFSPSVETYSR